MVYLDLAILMNFTVDLLLLLGTNRLAGFPMAPGRSALAAMLGGIYGGVCLVPGFRFLGNSLWRVVFLSLMALIAFGWNRSALQRGCLFVFLSMALGGIAIGIGSGGAWALIGAAAGVTVLCCVGFRGKAGSRTHVSLELRHGGKIRRMTALLDTGNTLTDPVTGRQVLIVGADTAQELLGLGVEELRSPVDTLALRPGLGLRLIPYRAVGQPMGMLLAVKMDEVRLNGKIVDMTVAFAPQKIGADGFEALAGGCV